MKNTFYCFYIKTFTILILVTITYFPGLCNRPDSIKTLETPPRIIRTCCSFGEDVRVMIIPFIKLTEIINKEDLGQHHYLGGENEGNGIIYTLKGGFIDIGHLRDQADWTSYLYQLIIKNSGNHHFELKLGKECGTKILRLDLPENMSNKDAVLLAGRIAYDLSVWHEIATWYGASTVPFVPERYSSFSLEDDYSNQLGILTGTKALLSNIEYNTAMTKFMDEILDSLQAVSTAEATYNAMSLVNDKWWTQLYKYPSKNILLKREVSDYTTTYPLLVPELITTNTTPVPVQIAKKSNKNIPLTNFYKLEFYLNGKIPSRQIFQTRKRKKMITNKDFPILLDQIKKDIMLLKYRKFKRRQNKN